MLENRFPVSQTTFVCCTVQETEIKARKESLPQSLSDGADCRKLATVENTVFDLGPISRCGADHQKQDSGQQHSVFGDVLAFVVR
jgi:hypothetical protein